LSEFSISVRMAGVVCGRFSSEICGFAEFAGAKILYAPVLGLAAGVRALGTVLA
jgi:hypothetical protein